MTLCTSIGDVKAVTYEDAHLQNLKSYIVHGYPQKDELLHSMRHY